MHDIYKNRIFEPCLAMRITVLWALQYPDLDLLLILSSHWLPWETQTGSIERIMSSGKTLRQSRGKQYVWFCKQREEKTSSTIIWWVFFLPLHWARAHHMTSIVWLCIVLSKHVLLQIIFCSCVVNETSLSNEKMVSLCCQNVLKKYWLNDKTRLLLNLVTAKYGV